MCRSLSNGGRRCSSHTEYGRIVRNLKAKKQYHNRKGNTEAVASVEADIRKYESESAYLESLEGVKIYPMKIELSPAANNLLSKLRSEGFKPYVVGGAVRDALTGQQLKDVDIEVYGAETDSLIKSLKKLTPHVDEVGQQFGVLKVQIDGEEFDVSLPRQENRTGSSHTSFEVRTDKDLTIPEASARRDFTVNALLYDPEFKHVLDPYNGMKDWHDRKLGHVSDAFDEDPLRVLRGAQMAARFNMELQPRTVVKAQTLASEFGTLAKERVQIEFQKLFTKSFHPEKGFKVLKETHWDRNFPGLGEVNDETLHSQLAEAGRTASEQKLDDDSRAALFGAVVASRISSDKRREFLSYITVGDRVKNIAYNLASIEAPKDLSDSSLRHWSKNCPNSINYDNWLQVQKIVNPDSKERLSKIEKKVKELSIFTNPEPDLIKGDSLMSLMRQTKNGRWVGEALRKIREAQYENKFRTVEEAERWVRENKDELLG